MKAWRASTNLKLLTSRYLNAGRTSITRASAPVPKLASESSGDFFPPLLQLHVASMRFTSKCSYLCPRIYQYLSRKRRNLDSIVTNELEHELRRHMRRRWQRWPGNSCLDSLTYLVVFGSIISICNTRSSALFFICRELVTETMH